MSLLLFGVARFVIDKRPKNNYLLRLDYLERLLYRLPAITRFSDARKEILFPFSIISSLKEDNTLASKLSRRSIAMGYDNMEIARRRNIVDLAIFVQCARYRPDIQPRDCSYR